jgi:hypothetical protein
VAFHPEFVYGRRVVHADFGFLRVVTYSHPDVIVASVAPYIVWHLEADDEDAHVELSRSLSQGMGTQKLVETSDARIIVGRIIEILTFAFSHCDGFLKIKNENIYGIKLTLAAP